VPPAAERPRSSSTVSLEHKPAVAVFETPMGAS
jgi:hypothetical protein